MGKTFKNIHASSTGKFDGNSDKIPQWIRANGGQYSKEVSEEITHLIATKEAFKDNVEAVRKAKRSRNIKIVSFDWLEDSLLSKNRRPKREKEYLLEIILRNEKKKNKRKADEKAQRKEIGEERKKCAGRSNTEDPFRKKKKGVKAGAAVSKYHLYTDKEARVTYNATLARFMLLRNSREKYLVKIYESNKEPHVYATHLEYSRIGKQQSELLTPLKADRDAAVKAFKTFFKDQTGMEWEKRLNGIFPSPKRDADGNLLPSHEGWFSYEIQGSLISNFLREEVVKVPGHGSMVEKHDHPVDLQGVKNKPDQERDGERSDGDLRSIYDLTGSDIEILSTSARGKISFG
ncbi:hypothetical protein BO94DRAFT_572371 [Aspergillus sclerotioniger CBS 115572]|uniref:Uncharacterized protein n=1 Tax=Aspergillus sclerotioniger CBS 115572 TaxID=1450535 RepID=A0A317XB67_9EURO|nr:hypothetical protein BO94DRAFT_572371 [Aspergillus sclerotioniger CBS 115572]PWY94837.1 hypothetical protein BO94DRAFT_572371 [Aspergillus sclerotioniger CBS 115572]